MSGDSGGLPDSVGQVARRTRRDAREKLPGEHALFGRLLYGTGLQITKTLQLQVKYLDFSARAVSIRSGKR